MSQKVMKELEKVAGIKKAANDTDQEHLIKLTEKLADLPDEAWNKMSEPAQNWHIQAVEARNKGNAVPTVEEVVGEDTDAAAESSATESPQAESGKEPPAKGAKKKQQMKERAAAKKKAAAPAKPPKAAPMVKQKKAAPAPKANGKDTDEASPQLFAVQKAVELHKAGEELTVKGLSKALAATKAQVPLLTIRRVVSIVPDVLTTLKK